MHPLGVVPVQELGNLLSGLAHAGPHVHVNALVHVFVLDGAPQPLHKYVVAKPQVPPLRAASTHAQLAASAQHHLGELLAMIK